MIRYSRAIRAFTDRFGAILLFLLTFLAYDAVFDAGFIWDDDKYVTENPTLRTLAGLREIWLNPRATPQYYPLVHTTFWIEYHFWGLHPRGYHVVNVLLHSLNASLLWLVLRRLSVPGAWIAAAIFALHPVQVESAAWVTERKNVLSGAFYLAALWAYLKWERFETPESSPCEQQPRHRWELYSISFLLFIGALLSKSVTATLPVTLAILLAWARWRPARKEDARRNVIPAGETPALPEVPELSKIPGRSSARELLPLIPFLLVGAAAGLWTAWLERHQIGAQGPEWNLTPVGRLLVAARALVFYAAKLLWPSRLTFIYPRWSVDPSSASQYLFVLGACAAFALLVILRRRIGPAPLAAALIFAVTLSPALGFVDVYPFRYSYVADHFQYLAAAAPIALVVGLSGEGLTRLQKERGLSRVFAPFVGALSGFLLLLLAILTARQCTIYADAETLWTDTIRKNPSAAIAYNNLGTHYANLGDYAKAEDVLRAGLARAPHDADLRGNLGGALVQTGKLPEAEQLLREALALEPGNPWALNNLGLTLARRGKTQAALEAFRSAIATRPTLVESYNNLATTLAEAGRADEAIRALEEGLKIAPDHPALAANLRVLRRRVEPAAPP